MTMGKKHYKQNLHNSCDNVRSEYDYIKNRA